MEDFPLRSDLYFGLKSGSEPLACRKKVQIDLFSLGIEAILEEVLEATVGAGRERVGVEGVDGTVRDNASCGKDIVRDLLNTDSVKSSLGVDAGSNR